MWHAHVEFILRWGHIFLQNWFPIFCNLQTTNNSICCIKKVCITEEFFWGGGGLVVCLFGFFFSIYLFIYLFFSDSSFVMFLFPGTRLFTRVFLSPPSKWILRQSIVFPPHKSRPLGPRCVPGIPPTDAQHPLPIWISGKRGLAGPAARDSVIPIPISENGTDRVDTGGCCICYCHSRWNSRYYLSH